MDGTRTEWRLGATRSNVRSTITNEQEFDDEPGAAALVDVFGDVASSAGGCNFS